MKKVFALCLIAIFTMTACSAEITEDAIPDGTYTVMDVRETDNNGYTVSIVLENAEGNREYFKYYTAFGDDKEDEKYIEFAKTAPGDIVKIEAGKWTIR